VAFDPQTLSSVQNEELEFDDHGFDAINDLRRKNKRNYS
jgi:hypothetical protein